MNTEAGINTGVEKPVPQKRVWGLWATVGFGTVVMVAFVLVQVLVTVIAGVVAALSQSRQASGTFELDEIVEKVMDILNANLGLLQSIATIASGIIGIGLILLFIKARKRAGIAEYLGLKKISWKALLLSIGVVIGVVVLADLLFYLLGKSGDEGIVSDIYNTSIWPPLLWIAVVIFAPLFEEAFFRGFLFEGFRQSRLGAVGAIILTSIGWALLHSLQYSIYNLLWIFVLGIAMGMVRFKTASIWSTFIMHALVNIAATAEMALN